MAEEGQVTACHTVQAWTEQLEKAQKSKQLTVVDFTASWCPPSVFMSPILAELAKNMPNVTFLMVDVDELRSVAFDWAVELLPTFLLLKEGKIVGKRYKAIPISLAEEDRVHQNGLINQAQLAKLRGLGVQSP
ncbi:hypothetical protein GH714_035263 [Hevea brasiliensis]|uniref:Thioredoxin domain-containing protein n=1 Tax=Hevea brasiliensis TaxID=3981 RepID=A0A6A6ND35_HEVBR|nr:hypothetical protein GH714_035263 [Hevea brasiliensis]